MTMMTLQLMRHGIDSDEENHDCIKPALSATSSTATSTSPFAAFATPRTESREPISPPSRPEQSQSTHAGSPFAFDDSKPNTSMATAMLSTACVSGGTRAPLKSLHNMTGFYHNDMTRYEQHELDLPVTMQLLVDAVNCFHAYDFPAHAVASRHAAGTSALRGGSQCASVRKDSRKFKLSPALSTKTPKRPSVVRSAGGGDIACDVCQRTFTRPCELGKHMKGVCGGFGGPGAAAPPRSAAGSAKRSAPKQSAPKPQARGFYRRPKVAKSGSAKRGSVAKLKLNASAMFDPKACPTMRSTGGKWTLNPKCSCDGGQRRLSCRVMGQCPHDMCPSRTNLKGTNSECVHFSVCKECLQPRSRNSLAYGRCRAGKGCRLGGANSAAAGGGSAVGKPARTSKSASSLTALLKQHMAARMGSSIQPHMAVCG